MARRSVKQSPKTAAAPPPATGPASDLALWLQVGNRQFRLGIAFLFLVTLALFGRVLLTTGHPVVGSLDPNTDLVAAEGPQRAFITQSLRHGVFPLWNPYVFSGQPFFTAGQAPLLYPPTWLHVILPLDKAINALFALHVFWIGLGMYLWAVQNKLRPASALVTAMTVMFGGPFFFHVYGGHIANISAMAWVPFLFLAIDLVLAALYWEGFLVGSVSLVMEILAGQPQYTFYALVAMVLYAIVKLIRAAQWPRKVALLAAGGVIAVGMTAFQWMLVLPQVGESIRQGSSVPRYFVAMLSFPPENLATLLAPALFGGVTDYWGRSYLWETSLFMGVSGVLLSAYGLLAGTGPRKWLWGGLALAMFVLALGAHTPLFNLLYAHVPGFNKFRGFSKFNFIGALFGGLLAGEGFEALAAQQAAARSGDRLASSHQGPSPKSRPSIHQTHHSSRRIVAGIAFALALAAGAFGLSTRPSDGQVSDFWKSAIASLQYTPESYARDQTASADFVAHAASSASTQLLIAAALLTIAGVLFLAANRAWPRYALFAMVGVELFAFAYQARSTIDVTAITRPDTAKFLKDNPGDYRILYALWYNEGMATRGQDIWGYDSFKLQRYAEFIAYSQHLDPSKYENLMWPLVAHDSPLLRLLRLRYVMEPTKTDTIEGGLPHLLLVNRYAIVRGRDNILASLGAGTFDPVNQVILETAPVPAPEDSGDAGSAQLVHEDANSLTIDANLRHAAILLITDSYSRSWKAVALPGSVQTSYQLLPADYVLRAIPLSAGVHHIRVEFDPPGMRLGALVSGASVVIYVGLLVGYARTRSRRRVASEPPSVLV